MSNSDAVAVLPSLDASAPPEGLSDPIGIPRSASFIDLPTSLNKSSEAPPFEPDGIRRTLSDTVLSNLENEVRRKVPSQSSSSASVGGNDAAKRGRQKSSRFGHHPKISVSKFEVTEQPDDTKPGKPSKITVIRSRSDRDPKPRSVTSSLSTLARKSFINPSRSPSPSRGRHIDKGYDSDGALKVMNLSDSTTPTIPCLETDPLTSHGDSRTIKRRSTLTGRKSKRPLSALLGKPVTSFDEENPVVPAIPKSFSSDRLPSLVHRQSPLEKQPMMPRSKSSDRLHTPALESPRKRDELWSNFRTLDGEFQKFLSKPSSSKTNTIRTILLPFLRTYAEHPSNKSLRAEDLDRRINILNKWWTGLLEMLNGRNGQSVSGNDRPAILEGVTGIMLRPEWKLSLPSIISRPDKARPYLKSRSTTSLDSTGSEFLAESVLHNVRNTFIQNLLSQMAFVVDKMSMRSVPASIASFCGKATAYAFFFCPGVAEILVRLWSIPSEAVRRVLDEYGIFRNANMNSTADKVAIEFPQHLRPLSFKSLPSLMRHLRRVPQLPLSSAYIPWYGPWIGRWAGRESDLFFVFIKHFYILSSEHLPSEVTKVERACAPCHVLVQGQLLTVLDATIHRSTTSPPYVGATVGPQPITFDDVLGVDASAAALPLPAPNTVRLMAENRLILLLREFLLDTSTVPEIIRGTFAESFGDLLKATSRQTSLFDHTACFTLCDFLEEAISILVRYYNNAENPVSFLDWPFWLDVCKRMMDSHNSMTEVRVYAFLYGLWGIIMRDESKKQDLCIDWLLTEDHFQQQFNHWCPMVRAYYMRLLCWRMARFDGEASDLNLTILATLLDRLRTTWSHYLYNQEHSEKLGMANPSTAPSNPAPGRCLLIIRNDVHPSPGGIYLSFDGLLAGSSAAQPTAYERHHSMNSIAEMPIPRNGREAVRSSSPGKRRWGLLKSIIPFTIASSEKSKLASSIPNSKTIDPSGTAVDPEYLPKGSLDERPKVEGKPKQNLQPSSILPKRQHLTHSFKFSLDWLDRPGHTPKDRRLYPPRMPMPAQLFLQSKRGVLPEPIAIQPEGRSINSSKYAGKALAEWALLIAECQNFFERRKQEGVPGNKFVETPTLGVDSFRKPG